MLRVGAVKPGALIDLSNTAAYVAPAPVLTSSAYLGIALPIPINPLLISACSTEPPTPMFTSF